MGPVAQIKNPWAVGLSPATLERIRENSRTMAQKVMRHIQGQHPRALKGVAQEKREAFEEMVFVAGCRAYVLDGKKEFSIALWNKHLKAVQAEGQPLAGGASLPNGTPPAPTPETGRDERTHAKAEQRGGRDGFSE